MIIDMQKAIKFYELRDEMFEELGAVELNLYKLKADKEAQRIREIRIKIKEIEAIEKDEA